MVYAVGGFLFWGYVMNKQQLIDKAIDDLKGVWPIPCAGTEPYTVLYYPYGGKESELATRVTRDGIEVQTKICTKKEFEARKVERKALSSDIDMLHKAMGLLGLEKTPIINQHQLDAIEAKIAEIKSEKQQHWYDYENQKALRLPPVGEVVLVSMNGLDCKAKVLEVTKNNCESLIACRVISKLDSRVGELKYFSAAKPLDWDKHSKRSELAQLIDSHGNLSSGPLADAILAAGYRKCDN